MKKSDIGLIGLAVMGENLVMNMESHGFTVSVFNRTTEKVKTSSEHTLSRSWSLRWRSPE